MKIKEKLFEIPVAERIIRTEGITHDFRILHIDEVGLIVEFGNSTPSLTTDYLRHFLTLRRFTKAYVEAKDVREAVDKFYKEYEGTTVGGENPESKAQWINPDEPILQLPYCERLHRNKNGEFTCGTPICENPDDWRFCCDGFDNNGEFGMCILEGYDTPEFECPIAKFYENLPVRTIRIWRDNPKLDRTFFVVSPVKSG